MPDARPVCIEPSRGVAWRVVFRRNEWTPSWKTEELIVFAAEERLQILLDSLRAVHPDALVDTTERLGDAVVLPLGQEGQHR